MENRFLMMFVFTIVFMFFLSVTSFSIFGMINKVSLKMHNKKLINFTLLFNAIFVLIYLVTFLVNNDFFI